MQVNADPIDKREWGVGPWQDEADRVEFEHAGLPCLMVRHPRSGHWCGYAAVPPGHSLHGKHYEVPGVSVHGGLTYAASCRDKVCHVPKLGEPDDVWWFGFDCAHSGDYVPSSDRYWGRGYPWPDHKYDHVRALACEPSDPLSEVYRDLDYVKAETMHLADQLSRYDEGRRCTR